MLRISSGLKSRAQRVVLYGSEGIGKTTFAAQFPEPLLIDTENGSSHIDVRRIDGLSDWDALIDTVREVAVTSGICKTLVLDTADWAERMAIEKVCKTYDLKSIEAANYGKGYVYLSETFSGLLKELDKVIDAGIHVVVTAHAKMRKFEQPDEQGAYDRWEMKLTRNVAPLLKEWCDMLLFLNYRTFVVTSENKSHKAQGGKRVMFTCHHPCWDAKNRHGLKEELPMSFDSIAHIFTDGAQPAAMPAPQPVTAPPTLEPVTAETLEILNGWMDKAGIQPGEIQTLVAQKGHFTPETPIAEYPEKFVRGWLMKNWDQVVTTINADPEHTPF